MVIEFVDIIFIVGSVSTTRGAQCSHGNVLKRGLDQPYTNWSGARAVLLMSPRQDETNDL